MKKKLFTLLLCAFAVVSANANRVENGIWYVYGENNGTTYPADNVGNLSSPNQTYTKIKLIGEFSGWSGGAFTSGNIPSVTEIDLSEAKFTVKDETCQWSFQNYTGLETIKWPQNDGDLDVLPTNAFYKSGRTDNGVSSGLKEITLPPYVKFVKENAFSECPALTKITIPATVPESLIIRARAFNNSKNITDVYVLCEKNITAEFNAFDFDVTNGQGNPENNVASLHFPESVTANFANLEHELDYATASNPADFHVWLVDHRNKAQQTAQGAGNGWFEFVNSGSLPPPSTPVSGNVILTTYSNYGYDHLVPAGFKAYVVRGITEGATVNGKKTYSLALESIVVIPKQTGVILYGQANAKTADSNVYNTYAMTTVNYTGYPLRRANWERNDNWVKNHLEPTDVADGDPQISVKPFDYAADGTTVEWRNFAMGKYSSTDTGKKNGITAGSNKDFVGFFRLKKGILPKEKAYLRLKADEYKEPEGGEVIVPKDDNYNKIWNDEGTARIAEEGYWDKANWEQDWGVRGSDVQFAKFVGEPIIEENEDGSATLIISAEDTNSDSSPYYTLQGIKVNNPAKGVYVKNGKKVIIK